MIHNLSAVILYVCRVCLQIFVYHKIQVSFDGHNMASVSMKKVKYSRSYQISDISYIHDFKKNLPDHSYNDKY